MGKEGAGIRRGTKGFLTKPEKKARGLRSGREKKMGEHRDRLLTTSDQLGEEEKRESTWHHFRRRITISGKRKRLKVVVVKEGKL